MKDKMKILILSNSLPGLFQFRKELILKLIEEGYSVTICAPNGKKKEFFIENKCRYIEVKMKRKGKNPFSELKLLFHYLRLVKKEKPGLVLTYTIKPNLYGGIVCRLLKVKHIANITGLGSLVNSNFILLNITKFLYRFSLQKSSCVFFQNDNDLYQSSKIGINTQNKRLIPGSGVNLDQFQYQEYPPTEENLNFLFIGRVMKEKGIDFYLDAAKFIRTKYPNTCFHIVGPCEDDYSDKLEELHNKGIVIYHGLKDDVSEIYKLTHCTIHPTYYAEGMSNVLLESAASGRPVIATDRPGCREIIDDGINGYLVKQKDGLDLISKIENFIRLEYEVKKQMGISGRKKVEREFDRNLVISAYLEEIKMALG
jgi:galacturonosyltransferase